MFLKKNFEICYSVRSNLIYIVLLNQKMHSQHTQLYSFYKSFDMFRHYSTILKEVRYRVLEKPVEICIH
jgi:hypothetical protein